MNPFIISTLIITNLLKFEVAISEKERIKGLMYRKNWGNIDGMLFLHNKPEKVVYWMKNTYLNMYLLFIDDKFNLTEIKYPKILSEDLIISCSNNIKYVLEIKPEISNIILSNYEIFKKELSNKIIKILSK